ncbi:hypothetical protein [Alkalimarinus alittae]|uniref:Uncharacterized protein n=1 Tax=Alkalimarinus alittae TaxID=2961619 RepID=A0ABY6MXA0_9ALTE|nr:hypothetical protein [Alkalimarinus alittae]UZE94417.1 hypothetical protein NKI27_09945 [Alkalimarinus alittae]
MKEFTEIEDIELVLLSLEDLDLDCDGVSDQASVILDEYGISHKRMAGTVTNQASGDVVVPHSWLELVTGEIVDFRLRKWLGDRDEVPHGIFVPQEQFKYLGEVDQRERYTERDCFTEEYC